MALRVSDERRHELRIVAAHEQCTMQDLVGTILAEWLDVWSSTHPGVLDQ